MHYIIYTSTATELMPEEELKALLETARNNNTAHNISGMLLYSNGVFLQVLEGDNKDDLDHLYRHIEQDERHHSIIRLIGGKTDQRQFPDWSMGFHSLNPETAETSGFNDFMNQNPTELTPAQESAAWKLLLLFKRNNRP